MIHCRACSRAFVVVLLMLALASPAQAGLVAGSTRVIYYEGDRERSLMLANKNTYQVLVEVWIDDGAGDPAAARAPFVVLPAVFRMHPQALQGLRIVYSGDPLPRDRESVFWLNLYEIPPNPGREIQRQPHLEMAMDTQFKLFFRPKGVGVPPAGFARDLSFTLERDGKQTKIVCRNPTPWHASFQSLSVVVGTQEYRVDQEADMMTRPFAQHAYGLSGLPPSPPPTGVHFSLIDDSGVAHDGEAPLDAPSMHQ